MGTYSNLLEKGFNPNPELKKRSAFVVSEGRCKFRMEGIGAYFSCGFQIDGDVISDAGVRKCDKLLLIALDEVQKPISENGQWLRAFIELKGANVEHAISQLEDTVKHKLFFSLPETEVQVAYAVATRVPSNGSSPEITKAREKFQRQYKCRLEIIKSNNPQFLKPVSSLLS